MNELEKENLALKGELDKLKTFQYYFEYMKDGNSKRASMIGVHLLETELEFINMSIQRKRAEITALQRVRELLLNK